MNLIRLFSAVFEYAPKTKGQATQDGHWNKTRIQQAGLIKDATQVAYPINITGEKPFQIFL